MKDNSPITTISRCDVTADERLDALRELKKEIDTGKLKRDRDGTWVNNHIHTCYSFSPYTPTSAVFYAWKAGLGTAGIMDHDSVGGAREFIEAGSIMEMPVTCGFECRANVKGTALEGKRINNPDQLSCAYLAMHGIPHQNIDKAEEVLKGVRKKRNERNRKMVARISDMVKDFGLTLDFEQDVYPISMAREGGSITERHVLFALTEKVVGKYPEREDAICLIEKLIGKKLDEKTEKKLLEAPENFYKYDVLGVLKSSLVSKIYIDADEELINITEFTALADKLGAISAYAYLGDVGESPTGDKKAQKFEDSYLTLLFEELKRNNFKAVTYMPSRNTKEQLATVIGKCREYSLFEISGEDINSPRQSFICQAIADPAYEHLVVSTYALIGHEKAATADITDSMFSDKTKASYPDLTARVNHYAEIGGMK